MILLSWAIGVLLGLFTLRRYLFWFASLLTARPCAPSRDRSVAILVAARNEAAGLPRLLSALERIDYPANRLTVVLISDGSTDATAEIIGAWAGGRVGAKVLVLSENLGKGGALQAGLQIAGASDLVAVIDADTLPRPDALARLAGAFDDERVGGACGYPDPGVAQTSMVARYAALERWVSHLVTFAGKDRLGFQPPVIGAFCCIRATALAEIGGFARGTLVEDIHLGLELSRTGWKTRWIGQAVAREDVPTDLKAFRLQRLRWSRGLMASSRKARGLEEWLAAAGYLDRLTFVAGVVLAALGLMSVWVPIAYAMAPVAVIATALHRARPPNRFAFVMSIVPMILADIAVTLESVAAQVAGAGIAWRAQGRQARP
jgi:1,2-diacylglycerol 3-beta-glucosyltransferase